MRGKALHEAMPLRLSGKTALITGAGSGIGRAIATLFSREGANVCLADVDLKRAEQTASLVNGSDDTVFSLQGDVTKGTDMEKVIQDSIARFGRLDVLVNNAGFWIVGGRDRVTELPEEEWDRVLNVNLKGVFITSKYALRQMVKQRNGSIVNIASEAGIVGQLGLASYTAAKGGVVMLTKQMAIDYAPYGIRVNCIAPCNINTPMFDRELQVSDDPEALLRKTTKVMPLGRLGKPDEVAYAAVFLASDESSFTTGAVLTVDAGVTAGGTHTYPHD